VPAAVVNYLCLLGWSPKDNREKLSLAEAVERFDLPRVLRANARFDMAKLEWLNGEYLRELGPERFRALGAAALGALGYRAGSLATGLRRGGAQHLSGQGPTGFRVASVCGLLLSRRRWRSTARVGKDFAPENQEPLGRLRDGVCEFA
jgi:hypothetical protein